MPKRRWRQWRATTRRRQRPNIRPPGRHNVRLIPEANGATISNRRLFFVGGSLKEIIERILAPLAGLRMWGLAREADVLIVQFGERREVEGTAVGAYTLRVSCAWRLAGPTTLLVASGDLFTPADENADLETFDWDARGASWWDVRIDDVGRLLEQPVTITTFLADSYGGVRLVATGGIELEIFPNSSPSPHVETEFWRLVRAGDSADFVTVGTTGIELVQPT